MLNSEKVEYLLVGGYAVGHYGYARATGRYGCLDCRQSRQCRSDGSRASEVWFRAASLSPDMFLADNKVLRMGIAPVRIDIITSIEGVDFGRSFANRVVKSLDGVEVNIIGLDDLKANKRALGRPKDLDDLSHLP